MAKSLELSPSRPPPPRGYVPAILCGVHMQGRREGAGGYNDPGAHGFLGGYEGAHELQEGRWLQRAHKLERGPIEMTLRNQHVNPEDLFFFRRSPNFDRKNR